MTARARALSGRQAGVIQRIYPPSERDKISVASWRPTGSTSFGRVLHGHRQGEFLGDRLRPIFRRLYGRLNRFANTL